MWTEERMEGQTDRQGDSNLPPQKTVFGGIIILTMANIFFKNNNSSVCGQILTKI